MSDNKPESAQPASAAASLAQIIQEQTLTLSLVDNYEKALERDAKTAYAHQGYALFHSVNPELAQRQLLKLGHKPKDALDHFNVGCLHAADEKFKDAVESFTHAIKLDPTLRDAKFNLALACESAGDLNAAKKHWNELLLQLTDETEATEVRNHLKELV